MPTKGKFCKLAFKHIMCMFCNVVLTHFTEYKVQMNGRIKVSDVYASKYVKVVEVLIGVYVS